MKIVNGFLFLFCMLSVNVWGQQDTVKVHRHPIRQAFVFYPGGPSGGNFKNSIILGPELNVSGDGEFFFGAGMHLDWVTSRAGQHEGHWQYCDHIFTARWNWYADVPYHFGIDLEYDMFRSYSGYGKSRFKFIGGVKVSHLYDFTYHEIVWSPLLGITAMGIVDLKFGYVLPFNAKSDYFYNTHIVQFNLVWRPFLKWHLPVL